MGIATGLLALAVLGADETCPSTAAANHRAAVAYTIPWDDVPALVERFQKLSVKGFAPHGWRRAKTDDAVRPASAASSSAGRSNLRTLTLREAIRMGLLHSESKRVAPDGPAARCAVGAALAIVKDEVPVRVYSAVGADPRQLRVEVEVLVSLVEEQYWKVAHEQVRLWSCELAVRLGEDVHRREQTALEAGHGTTADAAETAQRLAQFRLDLQAAASDAARCEGRLRALLGLDPRSQLRLVPVSSPSEVPIALDEAAVLRLAEAHRDEMLEQRARVARAAACCLAVQGFPGLIATIDPRAGGTCPSAAATQARSELACEVERCDQLVRELEAEVERACFEVSAGYEQMALATRLREAAARRLEAQRAAYEGSQITIDRYLDAISQYAGAVAREARLQSEYNIALATLEDQQGTHLASRGIRLAEPPRAAAATDMTVARGGRGASPVDPAIVRAAEVPAGTGPADAEDEACCASAPPAAPLTIKLDLIFGRANPVQLRGSISVLRGETPSASR